MPPFCKVTNRRLCGFSSRPGLALLCTGGSEKGPPRRARRPRGPARRPSRPGPPPRPGRSLCAFRSHLPTPRTHPPRPSPPSRPGRRLWPRQTRPALRRRPEGWPRRPGGGRGAQGAKGRGCPPRRPARCGEGPWAGAGPGRAGRTPGAECRPRPARAGAGLLSRGPPPKMQRWPGSGRRETVTRRGPGRLRRGGANKAAPAGRGHRGARRRAGFPGG